MSEIIFKAIRKINSNAHMIIRGNDINNCEIEWLNNTTPISKEDIEAQFPIVELEMAMSNLRAKRNKLLADSDWTVLNDVPLNPATKSAWMNYRTLLRNITNNLNTIEDVKAVTLPIAPK